VNRMATDFRNLPRLGGDGEEPSSSGAGEAAALELDAGGGRQGAFKRTQT